MSRKLFNLEEKEQIIGQNEPFGANIRHKTLTFDLRMYQLNLRTMLIYFTKNPNV